MSNAFLPLAVVERFVPLAEQQHVSEVARSARGFLPQYRQHGARGLDPWWQRRRENFINRHMAQVAVRREELFKPDGTPSRRHLALIMWAYSPAPERLSGVAAAGAATGAAAARKNPARVPAAPTAPAPVRALEREVQRHLTPDLLHPAWAEYVEKHPHGHAHTGHCAAATAAFWYLAGGTEAGWRQRRLTSKEWPKGLKPGESHYWIEHGPTGVRVDPTAAQFGSARVPYEKGVGAGVPARPGRDLTGRALIKKEGAVIVERVIGTGRGQNIAAAAQDWSYEHVEDVRENPAPAARRGDHGDDHARRARVVEWLVGTFTRERERYGLPQATLGISDVKVQREKDRDYAVAAPADCAVWLHPAALDDLDHDNLLGLVRHELAHLVDPNLSESATDQLAERLSGTRIRYDARCVQTVSKKKGTHPRRPKHLPEW